MASADISIAQAVFAAISKHMCVSKSAEVILGESSVGEGLPGWLVGLRSALQNKFLVSGGPLTGFLVLRRVVRCGGNGGRMLL